MTATHNGDRTEDQKMSDPALSPQTHSIRNPREDRPVILLVDDDESLLTTLGDFLKWEFDAQVLTAVDNAIALDHLHRSHVDLIIQDLKRPGGGGIELLQVLKADPRYKSVRVIVLSAYAGRSPEAAQEALRGGADAVIGKPTEPGTLCQAVRDALGLSEQSGPR